MRKVIFYISNYHTVPDRSKKNPLVCANWKMNKTLSESVDYFIALQNQIEHYHNIDVVVFPSSIALAFLSELREPHSSLSLGAQNIHAGKCGPYTGELSIEQVHEFVQYVLIGHSERRMFFCESEDRVADKVYDCFQHPKIFPVLCIGETQEIRNAGHTLSELVRLLEDALEGITEDVGRLVIAYEPYWAISDGKTPAHTPTPDDVYHATAIIRDWLIEKYGADIAQQVRILYGGSVTSDNAADLYTQGKVDGFLVGGASLSCESFLHILDQVVSS